MARNALVYEWTQIRRPAVSLAGDEAQAAFPLGRAAFGGEQHAPSAQSLRTASRSQGFSASV
jgi:hypothetical protein